MKHATRLVGQHRPDIILAEAVGSCTDLAATVYEPLQRFHASEFVLAPLSVFVEPDRIREMLGSASQFEESVRYLFEKQLEEAELIILNKTDLLRPAEAADLRARVQQVAGRHSGESDKRENRCGRQPVGRSAFGGTEPR